MILIADSGSTKTDWRLIDADKNIQQFSCDGISPYFLNEEQIVSLIDNQLQDKFDFKKIEKLFYYGTGCSSPKQVELVKNALQTNFKNAKIEVNHDLLAAARAVCGKQNGMAAILGTGSNTCVFNGNEITHNQFSAGFILGDEGSGAHIGKTFIQNFLRDELPKNILIKFETEYKLSKYDIIEKVYKQPTPNRFLASFAKFVFQNKDDKFLNEMVKDCFVQFFKTTICKYPDYKKMELGFVGSIANYYREIIIEVANSFEVKISKIIPSPIDELTQYHSQH
ncbi:MAG: N-acetylglucosamine kinase [Bacteroidota bacterium]